MAASDFTYLDYVGAKVQIKKLMEIIEDCVKEEQAVKKLYQGIPNVWQGEAATAAIEKLQQWEKEFIAIRKEIVQITTDVNNKIEQLKAADSLASSSSGSSGAGHSSGSGRKG